MSQNRIKTDLLVIGGGSGGLSLAAGAAQMGAKVVLLEAEKMGGDCLNYGCVPSKSLLASAKAAHYGSHKSQALGQNKRARSAAIEHVYRVIDKIKPHDSQERFEGLGVQVIREFGFFVSPDTVRAGEVEITARRIVISTGSYPFIPPIEGLSKVDYLTNETLFQDHSGMEHLIILGAGPIGVEMAQAHIRLGMKVSVVEAERVLSREDEDAARLVQDQLSKEGVTFHTGVMAQKVEKTGGGVSVTLSSGKTVEGSHLLVATGRVAKLNGLNLEAAGIKHDARGVDVDSALRTSNKKVFAIGDAAGQMQFTHVAAYHAGLVLRSSLFALPARQKTGHIPRVVFSDPECAQIGLTEAASRAKYKARLTVIREKGATNDRAVAEGRDEGFIKLMIVSGRPVGVTIVGPQAGELIAFWSFVFSKNFKLSALTSMVVAYPTRSALNTKAIGAYFAPKLFESIWIKRFVRMSQKWVP